MSLALIPLMDATHVSYSRAQSLCTTVSFVAMSRPWINLHKRLSNVMHDVGCMIPAGAWIDLQRKGHAT